MSVFAEVEGGMTAPLQVRVLGPVTVRVAESVVPVSGPRATALLSLLCLHRNETVSTDRIAGVLWRDDPPGGVGNAIQARVSALRRAFAAVGAAAPIRTVDGGYLLTAAPGAVDADRFERSLADARRQTRAGDDAAAERSLRAALGLWSSTPYPELVDDAPARGEVARLEELRRAAVRERLAAALRLGRCDEVVTETRRLVAAEPLDEELHELLMTALARTGRQSDALSVFEAVRGRLRDELGVDPGAGLQRAHRAVLLQDDAIPVAAPDGAAAPPRLPQPLTPLLGRDAAVRELAALLSDHRLVTVTGPGGIGKTRLALEVGRREADRAGGEVRLLELAAVQQADGVLPALGVALGLAPAPPDAAGRPAPRLRDRIAQRLRDRDVLLVVDNCEHLIDAAAETVEAVLATDPGVRVLATSREGLRVRGERLWPTPPLDLPAPGADDPGEIARVPSTALLVERAQAANPGFRLDRETAPLAVELVRRLDGLPLAIELAAARLSSTPLETVVRRLGDRFDLLTGGARTAARRQQTLEAVVDWSYDLLDEPQRRVFERLAVFAAGATPAAAEAVCADPALPPRAVLPGLGDLVDRSLATLDPDADPPRYGMLETLRLYAWRRLAAVGDAAAVRSRHLQWFTSIAEAAWSGLRGPEQLRWLATLERDHENFTAALSWAIRTDPATALRLGSCLAWYWWLRDHLRVGAELLGLALDAAADLGTAAAPARAAAAAWRAFLLLFDGADPDQVRDVLDGMRADVRAAPLDDLQAAIVGVVGGFTALGAGGTPEEALDAIDEGERHAARAGDRWAVAAAAFTRGQTLTASGRSREAADEVRRALTIADETGDRWAQFQSRQWLGLYSSMTGRYAEALDHYDAADVLAEQLGLGELASPLRAMRAMTLMLAGDHVGAGRELEGCLADAPDDPSLQTALAHHGLGLLRRRTGDHAASVRHHRAAAERFGAFGQTVSRGEANAGVVFAAARQGDAGAARASVRLALNDLRDRGGPPNIALGAEAAAAAAAAGGDGEAAARLLGWADAVRRGHGLPLVAGERFDVDHIDAQARRLAGDAAVDAALAAGAAADLDDLLEALAAPARDR